jgi:hypothetical protein
VAKITRRSVEELVRLADLATSLPHPLLAQELQTSTRTLSRWKCGESTPSKAQLVELARLAYPKDAPLAREIVEHVGESLESAGIAASPPGPLLAAQPEHLVDGIVCVAADAMSVTPAEVRPALVAALRRMRDVGLALDVVVDCLARRVE